MHAALPRHHSTPHLSAAAGLRAAEQLPASLSLGSSAWASHSRGGAERLRRVRPPAAPASWPAAFAALLASERRAGGGGAGAAVALSLPLAAVCPDDGSLRLCAQPEEHSLAQPAPPKAPVAGSCAAATGAGQPRRAARCSVEEQRGAREQVGAHGGTDSARLGSATHAADPLPLQRPSAPLPPAAPFSPIGALAHARSSCGSLFDAPLCSVREVRAVEVGNSPATASANDAGGLGLLSHGWKVRGGTLALVVAVCDSRPWASLVSLPLCAALLPCARPGGARGTRFIATPIAASTGASLGWPAAGASCAAAEAADVAACAGANCHAEGVCPSAECVDGGCAAAHSGRPAVYSVGELLSGQLCAHFAPCAQGGVLCIQLACADAADVPAVSPGCCGAGVEGSEAPDARPAGAKDGLLSDALLRLAHLPLRMRARDNAAGALIAAALHQEAQAATGERGGAQQQRAANGGMAVAMRRAGGDDRGAADGGGEHLNAAAADRRFEGCGALVACLCALHEQTGVPPALLRRALAAAHASEGLITDSHLVRLLASEHRADCASGEPAWAARPAALPAPGEGSRAAALCRALREVPSGPLTLVFVSPEYAHMSESAVGGLGVFVAHLAEAMAARRGLRVHVVTPLWAQRAHGERVDVLRAHAALGGSAGALKVARFTVDVGSNAPPVISSLHSAQVRGVQLHLLKCAGHFEGPPYAGLGLRSAAIFALAAVRALEVCAVCPHVLVSNDWTTGLLPAAVRIARTGRAASPAGRAERAAARAIGRARLVHLVHNLEHGYDGCLLASAADLAYVECAGLSSDLLLAKGGAGWAEAARSHYASPCCALPCAFAGIPCPSSPPSPGSRSCASPSAAGSMGAAPPAEPCAELSAHSASATSLLASSSPCSTSSSSASSFSSAPGQLVLPAFDVPSRLSHCKDAAPAGQASRARAAENGCAPPEPGARQQPAAGSGGALAAVNLSRAALLCADRWATVGRSYAARLCATGRLAALLCARGPPLVAPASVPVRAHVAQIARLGLTRAQAKAEVQLRFFGQRGVLPRRPLLAFVGRVTRQKAVHLLLDAFPALLRSCAGNVQLLVCGRAAAGDRYASACAAQMRGLRERFPEHFWARPTEFCAEGPLVNLAADLCVMPSLFEPGGLVQHEFLAAGTPVVASDVDGLRDTLVDFDDRPADGCAFVLRGQTHSALLDALERALRVYHAPGGAAWAALQANSVRAALDVSDSARTWHVEMQRMCRWLPTAAACESESDSDVDDSKDSAP